MDAHSSPTAPESSTPTDSPAQRSTAHVHSILQPLEPEEEDALRGTLRFFFFFKTAFVCGSECPG